MEFPKYSESVQSLEQDEEHQSILGCEEQHTIGWLDELRDATYAKNQKVLGVAASSFKICCIEVDVNHSSDNLHMRVARPHFEGTQTDLQPFRAPKSTGDADTLIFGRTERGRGGFIPLAPRSSSSWPSVLAQSPMIQDDKYPDDIMSLRANVDDDDFLIQALSSKKSSSGLQKLIQESDAHTLEFYTHLAMKYLKLLVDHKYGYYLIQRLIQRSWKFGSWLMNLNMDLLVAISTKEWGSKVLQYLLSIRNDFCKRALQIIHYRMDDMTDSASSVFFICACVEEANKTKIPVDWILDFLLSDCAKVLTSKYRKRIVLTFLKQPNQRVQDRIYTVCLKGLTLKLILRDKIITLMFSHLLSIGYKPAEDQIVSFLQENNSYLGEQPFFEILLHRIKLKKESPLLQWIQNYLVQYVKVIKEERTQDEKILLAQSKKIINKMLSVCSHSRNFKTNTELQKLCKQLEQETISKK